MGVIDAAVKDHFGGPLGEALGRELAQEGDWVVVELPPADGIEVAEEVDDLRVPGPPQIARQRPAFVVERLGRHFSGQERAHFGNKRGVDRRHAKVLLRRVQQCVRVANRHCFASRCLGRAF